MKKTRSITSKRFVHVLIALVLLLLFLENHLENESATLLWNAPGTTMDLRLDEGNFNAPRQGSVSFWNGGNSNVASIDSRVVAETASSSNSFAACLLVMDDNHRLAEWIAYHYHVLSMKYLVVRVDPRSKESPEPILQLFRQHLNMTIVVWDRRKHSDEGDHGETAHQTTSLMINTTQSSSAKDIRQQYLEMQKLFLRQCMHHLSKNNQTWTALWDTDEFIVFHDYERKTTPALSKESYTSPRNLQQPDSVIRYLEKFHNVEDASLSCVALERTYVGVKATDPSILSREQRYSIHPFQLDTLRYRYQNDLGNKLNGRGKVILNVKFVNHSFVIKSPHNPAPYLCHNNIVPYELPLFYLKHYISSWESYSFRDDSRKGQERSYEAYMQRANMSVTSKRYEGIMATSWLTGFVESVGESTAMLLLHHAGLPLDMDASNKTEEFKCVTRCGGPAHPKWTAKRLASRRTNQVHDFAIP